MAARSRRGTPARDRSTRSRLYSFLLLRGAVGFQHLYDRVRQRDFPARSWCLGFGTDELAVHARQGQADPQGVTSTEAASTDIPGFYKALAGAIKTVNFTRFMPPEVIVMSPVRYSWLCSLVDDSHRPLIQPYAAGITNAAGVLQNVAAERIVGQLMGLPTVID